MTIGTWRSTPTMADDERTREAKQTRSSVMVSSAA